jgi:hypothetical protein
MVFSFFTVIEVPITVDYCRLLSDFSGALSKHNLTSPRSNFYSPIVIRLAVSVHVQLSTFPKIFYHPITMVHCTTTMLCFPLILHHFLIPFHDCQLSCHNVPLFNSSGLLYFLYYQTCLIMINSDMTIFPFSHYSDPLYYSIS